jgi:hypothetical protein
MLRAPRDGSLTVRDTRRAGRVSYSFARPLCFGAFDLDGRFSEGRLSRVHPP